MGLYNDLAAENVSQAEADTPIEAEAANEASVVESSTANATSNTAISIPLSTITTDFKNTRRKVNQADVEGLKCSIEQIGLISAITVRPMEEGQYQLVSGFNRIEALRQLGYRNVNAIVLNDVDEANVLEANIAENMVRKGLSLGEQSSAIKRLFTTLEGSEENKIDQISVRLNLSAKAVKDRLVLTALNEEGLAAFDEGKINLKSAIVLAGLTEQEQRDYLHKLTSGVLTHEGLLEAIGKATIPLSLAKFDLTDCQQCPSNSELQGSLFTDAASQCEASCQNPSCFKTKSKAWYDNRVVELEQEFGTIIPVSQVDRAEVNPISADVLGESQLSQCAACVNNVNLVQNKVGNTLGDVINNICNNKSCYTACAQTHSASQVTEQSANDDSVDDNAHQATTADTRATHQAPKKTKAKAQTSAGTLSKAAREQARSDIAAVQLAKGLSDPRDSAMLLFLAIERLTGENCRADLIPMVESVSKDKEQLQAAINKMLLTYLTKSSKETGDMDSDRAIGNILIALLNGKGQLEEAIIQSWTPAHLKHATKAGVKATLVEAAFDKAYDEKKGKGAFNKLMSSKVDVIHKAIEAFAFDFTDFAPKAYCEYARKVAATIK